jgi:hypothetical protein
MQLKVNKIELGALDEIRALETEPNKFMDKAIAAKKEAKQNFIEAQNKYKSIVELCDKYLPLAESIGDPNTINIIKNKRKMANEMVKALNIDIKAIN